jgi:glyoxylase I family protein
VPSISGFHHVSYSVNDAERSAAWYQEVLGFAHHSHVQGQGFRRIRVRHPDSGIVVTFTVHDGGSADRFDELRTGLDHLAFQVADGEIAVWKRRFEDLGVDHSEIRANGGGGGAITLRDHDNIQLEVFAAASG